MHRTTCCLLAVSLFTIAARTTNAQTTIASRPVDAAQVEQLFRAAVSAARPAPGDACVAAIERALVAGACPTRVLTESAFEPLHENPRFHALIRRHASHSATVLVTPEEPGERLLVSGTIRDDTGAPVRGALVYVYHTDARGLYSRAGSNEDRPRIFGYLRTDAQGRYEYRTIRPASYPNVRIDQHVHYVITADGFAETISRLGFSDDPHWKDRRPPSWVEAVSRGQDGVARCTHDVVLKRPG